MPQKELLAWANRIDPIKTSKNEKQSYQISPKKTRHLVFKKLSLPQKGKLINENGNAQSEFILLYCADGKNNSKHNEQGPQSSPVTM